jgi:uncharacterized protein DUF3995
MKSGETRWPGYAAATWSFLFAVPSFLWALGSEFGASTTVAPSLVELAHDRVPWFIAVLWTTGLVKLVGAAIGLGLTRRWRTANGRVLVCCGWGAAVLLAWHGVLFVVQGILVQTGTVVIDPTLREVSRWYLYLWGPWFVLGGVAFGAAARAQVRASNDRRAKRIAAWVGAAGGLVLSVAASIAGVG